MKQYIDFELENTFGDSVSFSRELESNNVLLMFYRGTFWGSWVQQLKHVVHVYKDVLSLNTKIYAISVDGKDKASIMREIANVPFDILCDENLEVIKKYNLVDDELMSWDYVNGKARKTSNKRRISLSFT